MTKSKAKTKAVPKPGVFRKKGSGRTATAFEFAAFASPADDDVKRRIAKSTTEPGRDGDPFAQTVFAPRAKPGAWRPLRSYYDTGALDVDEELLAASGRARVGRQTNNVPTGARVKTGAVKKPKKSLSNAAAARSLARLTRETEASKSRRSDLNLV